MLARVGDPATAASMARRRSRRRRLAVYGTRVLIAAVVVGGWQLFTGLKIVDPFFFGQPTGIVRKLVDWGTNGTGFGTLWSQVWVTMKEALLGFGFGVAAGIVAGVLLGQIRFLSDVMQPFIKIVNAV